MILSEVASLLRVPDASDLRALTPKTVWLRAALMEETRKCGWPGYSLFVDEMELGLSAVAAPIIDATTVSSRQ